MAMDGSIIAGRCAGPADDSAPLIPLIYEAALSPDVWPKLLASLAKALGGNAASLRTAMAGGMPAIAASHALGPGAIGSYAAVWGMLDPVIAEVGAAWPAPATARQIVGPTLERTPFYAGWMQPNEIDDEACLALLPPAAPYRAVLGIGRPPHCSRFEMAEAAMLALLAPHLRRAMAVHRHLAAPREAAPLAAALDRLAAGVVLVDASGALAWGNQQGLALLAEADGIALDRHGRLHAETETAGEALQRALALALAGVGAAAPVPRPTGRPALAVLAVPLPPQTAPPSILPTSPGARVMLLLVDSSQGGAGAALEGRLRSLWGLTAAEAAVATQSAHGAGLPEVAHALGLAVTTARTHAQRVFAKAGLRGQAELARQVERLNLLATGGPPAASGAPPHTPASPPAIA